MSTCSFAAALQLRSAQLQLSALLLSPPPLPFSSPSSLPVAPRYDLISMHFVQLPYLEDPAKMGPADYALPPLCLFYLMLKTADNFHATSMATIQVLLLVSFATSCIQSINLFLMLITQVLG